MTEYNLLCIDYPFRKYACMCTHIHTYIYTYMYSYENEWVGTIVQNQFNSNCFRVECSLWNTNWFECSLVSSRNRCQKVPEWYFSCLVQLPKAIWVCLTQTMVRDIIQNSIVQMENNRMSMLQWARLDASTGERKNFLELCELAYEQQCNKIKLLFCWW